MMIMSSILPILLTSWIRCITNSMIKSICMSWIDNCSFLYTWQPTCCHPRASDRKPPIPVFCRYSWLQPTWGFASLMALRSRCHAWQMPSCEAWPSTMLPTSFDQSTLLCPVTCLSWTRFEQSSWSCSNDYIRTKVQIKIESHCEKGLWSRLDQLISLNKQSLPNPVENRSWLAGVKHTNRRISVSKWQP